eukprot:12706918-Heterocapsa_arctica.AAC.1
MWSPDNANVNENGALIGRDQGSDRAEVRALVAALDQSIGGIEVITDNQIKGHLDKLISIRWVKAHLKKEKAQAAGVSYEDWLGNDPADKQAQEGAETHGHTDAQ